jgi:DNA-binding MarR family transcriptional regulator
MMNDLIAIRQAVRTPAFDEVLADRLGLNPTDLRCFELLVAESDPLSTPGRLAELSGLTSGAITGVLDRLERGGFVTRRPDPADRRRISVEPVDGRVEELVAVLAPLDSAIDAVLAEDPIDQRVAIAAFLRTAGGLVAAETARLASETRGGFVGDTYVAPVGEVTRGRFVFASGAPRMAMNVAPLGPRAAARVIAETSASRLEFIAAAPAGELVRGSFDGPRPDVRIAGGRVEIRYRRRAAATFATRRARIALAAAVPWSIELTGGLTDLTGSLDGTRLERLDVDGGANHVDLVLPRPQGTGVVRLSGLASSVRLRRPAGIPIALRLAGGVSHLDVDGQRREQVSGKRRYVGPGFDDGPDRYELEILGGASSVVVGEG